MKRSLDMRYVGQVHECTVEIGTFEINEKTIAKVKDAFHRRHEELYTYSRARTMPWRWSTSRSTLYGLIDKPKAPKLGKGGSPAKALKGYRKAIFAGLGQGDATRRSMMAAKLGAERRVAGPAIIEEVTTTIVIEPGWMARLDPERLLCHHAEEDIAGGRWARRCQPSRCRSPSKA